MKDFKRRMLALHLVKGMTRTKMKAILKHDPQLKNLYTLPSEKLPHHFPFLTTEMAHHLKSIQDIEVKQLVEDTLRRFNVITIFDHDYPKQLRVIPDPPLILYLWGNAKLLYNMPALSVVGTRQVTRGSREKLSYLLSSLVQKDWTLISGMAKGIDTFAHELAIKHDGNTIAVLGFGFDYCYPSTNLSLMKKLGIEHLLLSEYPPTYKPQKWYFPERNRIISGLGFGTLVVEAKERSGSLITADQALEQGREVYAVPGSISSKQSQGCHKLIQTGAKLVQNTYDLLEDWKELEGVWCRFMSNGLE